MRRELTGYAPERGDFTGFLPERRTSRRQFLGDAARAVTKTVLVAAAGPTALAGAVVGAGEAAKSMGDKAAADAVVDAGKLDEYRAKSAEIARRDGHRVSGLGRFQLGLDGLNPDWCPNAETGLTHPTQTFSEQLKYETSHPIKLVDRTIDEATGEETSQGINTIIANKQGKFDRFGKVLNSQEAVTVYFGLYRNAVNYRESNLRVAEMAHEMPDRLLFAFDPPGMGDSDDFTRVQKEGMEQGDLTPIVDAQLRILAEKGITRINLAGYSMGARLALSTALRAAHHGITVDNLMLYEIPGVDAQDIPMDEMLNRIASENETLDLYHSNNFDPQLFVASGLDRPDPIRTLETVGFLAEQADDDPEFAYAYMCATAKVESELEQLFAQTNTNVVMENGDLSKVSPHADVQRIGSRFRNQYGSRMSRVRYNGVGHLAFVHPKELATSIKRTLVL